MDEISVSVVIPTCDRPQYLLEALDSVLSQTSPDNEILVIDNGRRPLSRENLPKEKNIQVVRALPRFGVSQARNLGAILSCSEYIAFLDDDDLWDKCYLEEVRACIRETGADLVLGKMRDKETRQPIRGKHENFGDEETLRRWILRRSPGTIGSNTVVSRKIFFESSGYDPWLTTGQDKALVLDLLFGGAKAVRAQNAWVDFRQEVEGPRQTEIAKRVKGNSRFLRKYWSKMDFSTRLFNVVQLGRLYMWRIRGAPK